MGIESYSIVTTTNENILSVNLVIGGKAMEPKDYQPIIDRIKAICEEKASVDNVAKSRPVHNFSENAKREITFNLSGANRTWAEIKETVDRIIADFPTEKLKINVVDAPRCSHPIVSSETH